MTAREALEYALACLADQTDPQNVATPCALSCAARMIREKLDALPPDEPPGTRAVSQGFCTGP